MCDVVIVLSKTRLLPTNPKTCFFQLEMFFIHSSWKFKTDFKYEQQLIGIFSSFGRSSDFFLNLVRMSSFASTEKKLQFVDKHGCRRPSYIFLVIASPQKPLSGFEWNLAIMFTSMSCCAATETNSGPSTNLAVWFPAQTFPLTYFSIDMLVRDDWVDMFLKLG